MGWSLNNMEVMLTIYDILLEYNICKLFFLLSIVVITILGYMMNFLEEVPLPHFLIQTFKFGKAAHKTHLSKFVSYVEVPKRWFLHFYIFSSMATTVALVQMWKMYVGGDTMSPWLSTLFDILTTPGRTPSVSGTSAVISLVLLSLQIYRRLYECLCVSVFSAAKMNPIHYLVGIGHYLGALTLLLAEFPGFDGKDIPTSFSGPKFNHIVGVMMFLCSFALQHQSLTILADLRKKQGDAGKAQHVLPTGGLFCLVSCPHMLAEIGVYSGVMVVLESHYCWTLVTLWVLANQVQVAVMNHKWYQETFKDYPRERKAIFPYLL